jgi:hypothetical protein
MEGNGATCADRSHPEIKTLFQHKEIWIENSPGCLAKGVIFDGNFFNLERMRDINNNISTNPYDISDPAQLAQCTFNRNSYRPFDGSSQVSEGFAVGVLPAASASAASPMLNVGGNAAVSGKLGVGTTNPFCNFSLGGGTGDKLALWDAGDGVNYGGFGVQSNLYQWIVPSSSNDITFGYGKSAGLTRNVTFKGNGCVGIGTATPSQKLEVYPNTDVAARIGKASIGYCGTLSNYAAFSHYSKAGTNTDYALLQYSDGSTMLNTSTGKKISFRENNSDKMVISGGNIGIGTATPVVRLDVAGDAKISGKLGIGSTAPSQMLEVYPNTDVAARIGKANIGYCGALSDYAAFSHYSKAGSSTDYALLQYSDGSTMLNTSTGKIISFRENNSNKMVISGGNVGIGTSTPTTKLDINADRIRIESAITTVPTSSSDASGNVGDIAYSTGYIYVKTASGWRRATLSTF